MNITCDEMSSDEMSRDEMGGSAIFQFDYHYFLSGNNSSFLMVLNFGVYVVWKKNSRKYLKISQITNHYNFSRRQPKTYEK